MSRGFLSRAVARAAASGGSKNYRARRPAGWYLILLVIVIAGVSLIAYSRNERLNPHKAASSATNGPSATDNWQAALAIDICGKVLPDLPANPNITTVGLRTFGDGLINIDPGAIASNKAKFEGKNATLGLFASSYPTFKLTAKSIHVPIAGQKTWTTGNTCAGPLHGPGVLQVKVFSSPTAKGKVVANPLTVHLQNNQMITIAFVPKGATIPVPPSRAQLLNSSGTTSTTTTTGSTSSTTASTSTTTAKK